MNNNEPENKKKIEEETIEEAMEELSEGDTVEIDCDDCGRWDGHSRRCECGNRRCCWNTHWLDGVCYAFPDVY